MSTTAVLKLHLLDNIRFITSQLYIVPRVLPPGVPGGPEPEVKEYHSVHLCEATTLNPHYEGNHHGYMSNDDG